MQVSKKRVGPSKLNFENLKPTLLGCFSPVGRRPTGAGVQASLGRDQVEHMKWGEFLNFSYLRVVIFNPKPQTLNLT